MTAISARTGSRAATRLFVRTDILPLLTAATLAAAAVELILLRLGSRIGIHIPALGWARQGYAVVVSLGNYAFPVAAVFALGTLTVLGLTLTRRAPMAALAAWALLGWQAWLWLGADGAAPIAVHGLLLAAGLAAVAAAATLAGREPRACLLLGLLVVGESLGLLQAASTNLAQRGDPLPVWVVTTGEVVVLAAVLLVPWLLYPAAWTRKALLAGTFASLLVGGALIGNGSTARILALWTFGLTMPAPALLYALAAGVIVATTVAHWQGGRTAQAAGLALVVLGGYMPPNSYQADLLLIGVLLLAFPAALDPRAEC